jgi:hypothetical protein
VIDRLDVIGVLTHANEWEEGAMSSSTYMAQIYKHKLANDFTAALDSNDSNVGCRSISLFGRCFDWFIMTLNLECKRCEFCVHDSADNYEYGIVTHEFKTMPGEATSETQFNVPHIFEATSSHIYINPHRQNKSHNNLFEVKKIIATFILPDIFSTMFQYGDNPGGKGKTLLFKFYLFDAQLQFQEVLIQTFFYKLLRIIGFNELWKWKAEGRTRLRERERKVDYEGLLILLQAYAPLYLTNRSSTTDPCAREFAMERLLKLECTLPLTDIMTLRRLCMRWTFSIIDGPQAPLLVYASSADVLDVLMSKHLNVRKLEYDTNAALISSFQIDAIMNNFCIIFVGDPDANGNLDSLPDYDGSLNFKLVSQRAAFRFRYNYVLTITEFRWCFMRALLIVFGCIRLSRNLFRKKCM